MLADKLIEAYFAYLPWLGLVIGIALSIVGASQARGGRRLVLIGLGFAVVSGLWLLVQTTGRAS